MLLQYTERYVRISLKVDLKKKYIHTIYKRYNIITKNKTKKYDRTNKV